MSDERTIESQCYGECWAAKEEIADKDAEIVRLKAERDEAVKAEREACAKVCDDHRRLDADLQQGIWVMGTAITLAAAIRARGDKP